MDKAQLVLFSSPEIDHSMIFVKNQKCYNKIVEMKRAVMCGAYGTVMFKTVRFDVTLGFIQIHV